MKKIISGKVRDVYDLENNSLVIVTTDRISAFDSILPVTIPGKGNVLNQLSLFWFDYVKDLVPNHILSANVNDMPEEFHDSYYTDRTVLVKKLTMLPYELIVRGYMFGSMWSEYKETHAFCGVPVEGDYQFAEKLAQPMFTPCKKCHDGHDENISYAQFEELIGVEKAAEIRDLCLNLFQKCYDYAYSKGIILADTKFEFGVDENGTLVLADEIFTPDSSRFWDLSEYQVGISPKSFDKQFVRDWIKANNDCLEIPADIAQKTAEKYQECLDKLTK